MKKYKKMNKIFRIASSRALSHNIFVADVECMLSATLRWDPFIPSFLTLLGFTVFLLYLSLFPLLSLPPSIFSLSSTSPFNLWRIEGGRGGYLSKNPLNSCVISLTFIVCFVGFYLSTKQINEVKTEL